MKFKPCSIEGLLLVESTIHKDPRGFFMETYNQAVFERAGIDAVFVQDNLSTSHKGVLRGLHAQTGRHAQGKLVRVVQGRVFDVAVDIRPGSPTFGQYHTVELSATDGRAFWIPPGFLHGFIALEDNTIFTYKVTAFYSPEDEIGVRWDDPDIGIVWPAPETGLIVSEKDQALPRLKELDRFHLT